MDWAEGTQLGAASATRCVPPIQTSQVQQTAGAMGDRCPAVSVPAAASNAPTTPTCRWGAPVPPPGNCGGEPDVLMADMTEHALRSPFGGPVVGDATTKPAQSRKGKECVAPIPIPAGMPLVPSKAHGGPPPIPYCSKPLCTGTFAAAARRAPASALIRSAPGPSGGATPATMPAQQVLSRAPRLRVRQGHPHYTTAGPSRRQLLVHFGKDEYQLTTCCFSPLLSPGPCTVAGLVSWL